MSGNSKTFSESWYRVAGQRVALRAHVQLQRQFYRGRKWYVVHDPLNNQFFRLHPPAYEFVARLHRDRTVQQVWDQCLALRLDEAPGQEEVIQLLAQLFYANLLQCDNPADSARLFERYHKRHTQEARSRLFSIMFCRYAVFDPDRVVQAGMPLVGRLISPWGAVLWFITVAAAAQVGVDHAGELLQQGQAILAPGNLFLLYVGLVLAKILHEFGHAFACRRFGGEVHEMGVMLLIFTPMPYVDATSSWALRPRWQRILVAGAGLLTELFVAALATFVWAWTGPGAIHSVAYNLIFVASVSTLIFNGNPLLRYDGYYVLSDLLDLPNLYGQATMQLRHLVERYAFGSRLSHSPAHSPREACWLTLYGVLSAIYRALVCGGILLFVGSRFLLVGVIMACLCAVAWIIMPTARFVSYLASSPRLERVRPRALAVSAAVLAGVIGGLEFVPMPYRYTAPGMIEAERYAMVVNDTAGALTAVLAKSDSRVTEGQPLLTLTSPELGFGMAGAKAQLQQAQALRRQALDQSATNLQPIDSHIAAVEARLAELLTRREALTVRARQDGIWSAPGVEAMSGAWLARGSVVGQIVEPRSFVFTAVVPQQEAFRLFAEPVRKAEVRLVGQPGSVLDVARVQVLPGDRTTLPSAALGWGAGGSVAVDASDPRGVRTTEPFFQVRAVIGPPANGALRHGHSGRIRVEFAPEPLLQQWHRKLRQLLQKRYRL